MTPPTLSRRVFLRAGATGGAALVVGFRLGLEALAEEGPGKQPPSPFDAWIRIARDGAVTLILPKSEMGQGVMTALPMVLAEELDVDWTRVKVEQAATRPEVYDHSTGGSSSVRTQYRPLRRAAAAARAMLVEAAAERLRVDPKACRTESGHVLTGAPVRRIAYGELVEEAARRPIPDLETVALKDPADFRIVGTDVPRVDVPAKVVGAAVYGMDVRVPGMLYAVLARCPTFGGRPKRFDAARARAVRGVREVLEIPPVKDAFSTGGVAVVADGTWAAMKGREALEIEWDHGPAVAESSESLRRQFEELLAKPGEVVRNDGDAEAALGRATRRLEAVYELPFQAHAAMEPLNATVAVRPDGIEAWLPSQSPQWSRRVLAKEGGLAPEKVVVHTTLMGGGFGRRDNVDYVVEAMQVSRAIEAPVKLVWTREDDMMHDFYRPASLHRMSAALDDTGGIDAWMHRMSSVSISAFWDPPEKATPAASEIGGAVNLPYAIPNLRMEYAPAKSSVPVMWWRSVEHSTTAFVVESFLDELAAAARIDPLALRLKLLAMDREVRIRPQDQNVLRTQRLRAVLEKAAAEAGWGEPLPPGRGRGLAGHFSFHSYAAQVAEVSVQEGRVRVHRVVAAVDCGRPINPAGIRAQVESAIVYGLSATLKGCILIDQGRSVQANFDGFDVMRIPDMPVVEVHVIPSAADPTGIGEPGLPPIAPAVANAIFAATGKRIRRLPVRAEDFA